MKIKDKQKLKSIYLLLVMIFFGYNTLFGQDVLTSIQFTIKNLSLSTDRKTISYDVYAKDIDVAHVCVSPAFTFRAIVPQIDLGTNDKTVRVINGTPELGAGYATMTALGASWLMKFNQSTIPMTNEKSLKISDSGDGTRLGTFQIRNADGSLFDNKLELNFDWSGSKFNMKSTMALFKPNTVRLASNSTTALPKANFIGLGHYSLSPAPASTSATIDDVFTLSSNLVDEGFYVNTANEYLTLKIYDLKGVLRYANQIAGNSYVNISSFESGVYMVQLNDTFQKIIKK